MGCGAWVQGKHDRESMKLSLEWIRISHQTCDTDGQESRQPTASAAQHRETDARRRSEEQREINRVQSALARLQGRAARRLSAGAVLAGPTSVLSSVRCPQMPLAIKTPPCAKQNPPAHHAKALQTLTAAPAALPPSPTRTPLSSSLSHPLHHRPVSGRASDPELDSAQVRS
ncbi:hypothetical protein BU26DRAFT_45588 [Trematosphaeria pertusa]|uniref:Uncharacterized protein n=1 Tax=Trematosphaeria pertusa TaxID=390896 RepID=A0A6A6I7V0_9PLEO|nr:uncharacterized protein BU26DRAFT_45588 [Trematosphaeria pertusa]KAF2246436.1 hypothetical protein BU26DRAFT_45588 [Trematosphaeria pertusa]